MASVVPSQLYESTAVNAGVAPWVDLPYRPPVGLNGSTTPVGKPRWCTAGDLRLTAQSGADAASDTRFYSFPVTVGIGVRCSLQGYPVIHLASPNRTWSATSIPLNDFAVPPGQIVDPRHPAAIGFRWVLTDDAGDATNTQTGTIEVTVDLPHAGGALTSSMTLPGAPRHGDPPRVGRVLAEPLASQTDVVYGGQYLTGLAGNVRVPSASIRAGSTFTYQVWVTGQPAATALLPGCAGYRERLVVLNTGATLTSEDHELNCTAVPTLPPSGRLFSMQIRVPAAAAPGTQVALEWEPDAQGPYPEGVSSSPTLTIV